MNSKTLLVTVSDDRAGRKDGRYEETQKKIQTLFEEHPDFGITQFLTLTIDDILQTPFYEANQVLLDNIDASRNGRCYKPYAIARGLSSLQEGEFLIYQDCSPELWNLEKTGFNYDSYTGEVPTYSLKIIQDLCVQNGGILTAFVRWDTRPLDGKNELGIHTHENFTTNRCMRRMGLEKYARSFMPASGMIVIQKTAKTEALVDEWLKFNLIDECACLGRADIPNDFSYWDSIEDNLKMGHRHDQSILGLLLCREGYKLLMPQAYHKIPGHNFLQYCRAGVEYKFMDPNYNPDTERRLRKGDKVLNEKGVELTVFEIWPEYGIEFLIVGIHRQAAYRTTKDKLKLIE